MSTTVPHTLPRQDDRTGPSDPYPPVSAQDRVHALITRAKAILSGQLIPPRLELSADLADRFREELRRLPAEPTPEAVARLAETRAIQAFHGGEGVVATVRAADGTLAVLAAGEVDVGGLMAGLSPEERRRVQQDYPSTNRLRSAAHEAA